MTKKAIISGEYTDIKTVKTRAVVQIVIEVPIEGFETIVQALGNPSAGTHVAVARLGKNAKPVADDPKPEPTSDKRKWNEMSYAQQAGMRCNEEAFQKFIGVDFKLDGPPAPPGRAASLVRFKCGVKSRSELDSNPTAAVKWQALDADYQTWLRYPEGRAA